MPNILISGGTGLIGKQLRKKLQEKDYNVILLSTDAEKVNGFSIFSWNPEEKEISKKAIEQADHIINLAGAGIGESRWTKARKQIILNSRLQSTDLLFENVKQYNKNLKSFISASAIGYYGSTTSETIFTETDAAANDTLGEICRQWEASADRFNELGIRTIKIRTGIVISEQGGALQKMIIPVKLGIGSALGNGKQYMPWIHINDLCDIYIKAIEDKEMKGAYNAVAPEHINNKAFTSTLAKTLHKPFWFPNVPAFILKLILGEMSDLVLKGSRISCKKITDAGFVFRFPKLNSALNDLFNEK